MRPWRLWIPAFAGMTMKNAGSDSPDQLLQPLGNLLRGTLVGEASGEPALRIHHIDDRAVVHRVVAAGLRMLRVIDPIALCCLGDLLGGPGQRQDRGIEARDVGFERLGSIPLGIDRDEARTTWVALRPELGECNRNVC